MPENSQAIIFTERSELRSAIRDELRKLGFKSEQLHSANDETETKDLINSAKSALLIVDWAIGPEIALSILDFNHARGKLDSCITFLLAKEMDPHIIAAAREYYVSQIHTGEVSVDQIRSCLVEIQREQKNVTPIKRLLKQVTKLRSQGAFDDIDRVLRPIYPKMHSNPRIALEHGQNLTDLQSFAEAEEVLKQATQLKPPSARARNLLARLYLKMGKKEEAAEALKGAQVISPYNVKRLVELGYLMLDLGKPAEANKSFESILDFAPKSKEAHMGKGSAMIAMGDINEALSILKESTNMSELASVFNNSAILAIQQGNHDDAMQLYKTAIEAVGKNKKVEARLWYNMGIGFVKWKKLDKSLECFEKSTTLDPLFKDASHNISVVKKAQGKNIVSLTKPKAKRAQPPPLAQAAGDDAIPVEPNHEHLISEMEETIGAENLSNDLGSLSFDLDFDDDLLD